MAKVDLVMPKMGESIMEATILKWVKQVGDKVEEDETILEIATDKVDSEIPSPVDGVIEEILFEVDDVVAIGKVIARIKTEGEDASDSTPEPPAKAQEVKQPAPIEATPVATPPTPAPAKVAAVAASVPSNGSNGHARSSRFYSPLVKNMAKQEGIAITELETIPGTGSNGRVTKHDMLNYISTRANGGAPQVQKSGNGHQTAIAATAAAGAAIAPTTSGGDEIIEMDRMRRLIADHMVMSKRTSPHVTSFVEADVTNMVNWRNANKLKFQEKYGEKITFTPLIMEAVIKALRDFPMINVSLTEDNKIHVKKNINLGMAAALPSGNLIVPVIKNADYLNLAGLTKTVNDLATRARANKLKPEDIQGGTFTLTNVGTFGNVMGTPIINQPQVAILAAGAIRKKPAVLETEYGDVIAVRQMMFLSHSYDHRVVDGFLGGSFVRRVADYLESFDVNRDF